MRMGDFCAQCTAECCGEGERWLLVDESEICGFLGPNPDKEQLQLKYPGLYMWDKGEVCPFMDVSKEKLRCLNYNNRPMDCRMYPFFILPQLELFYFDLGCDWIQDIVFQLESADPVLVAELIEIEQFMERNPKYIYPYMEHVKSYPTEVSLRWSEWVRIKEESTRQQQGRIEGHG